MIKGTKEIVTVRLSAKDLKNHREEVKDVMVKHKNHIMFLGVGKQTMKLFADSVPREVGYVIGYWNVAPKAVSRVTNELLESKGFKVYSRNGRWFVQWRSNKHRWTIRY